MVGKNALRSINTMDVIREKWEEILYTVKAEHELSDISFKTWHILLKVLILLYYPQ